MDMWGWGAYAFAGYMDKIEDGMQGCEGGGGGEGVGFGYDLVFTATGFA